MLRDYRKVKAWQLADDFVVAVYKTTKHFPREERYGLTDQFRRAAISVAANICEGASRSSKKDYLHFLYMARGSSNESQYYAHLAQRLGFLSEETAESLAEMASEAGKTLAGLIRAVEREAYPNRSQTVF